MKKLFLTSTGLPPETRQYFLDLLDKSPQDLKVAFIPTAADPEKDKWFVKASRNELLELGFVVWDVDLKKDSGFIRKKLEKSDILYINGGNTFYLMDLIRKKGVDKYLEQLIENGKIYLGVSAGSIIAGNNISVAGWKPGWDKNLVNLNDLRGFGWIPYVVSPHFTEEDRDLLEEKSKQLNQNIFAITDKQAILFTDNNYKVVGEGGKIIL